MFINTETTLCCVLDLASLARDVYMVEYHDYYIPKDFFHVYSGQLARSLKELNKFAMKHVYDCMLCSQKGFICEVCNSRKVIYPFETDTTHRCSVCNSVFHKSCMSEKLPCPRCQRWRRRQSKTSESLADLEDYANSPEL